MENQMHELTEFQQRAAAMAVVKLLNGETFYTSDVMKLAELLGRHLGGNDWKAMQPLHCTKWGDMDPDLRRMMREKVLELLGLPPQVIDAVEPQRPAEKPSEPAKRLRLAFWK
jgi:hypothetical protein